MNCFKQHHRLIALLLSVLMLVGMIPMTAISAAAAEADVAEDAAPAEEVADLAEETEELAAVGAKLDAAPTGAYDQAIAGYTSPLGISVTTSSDYPWTYDSANDIFTSGNYHVKSSKSMIKVTAFCAGKISFDFSASSESSSYDYICYKKGTDDTFDPTSSPLSAKIGGNYSTVLAWSDVTTWTKCTDLQLNEGEVLLIVYRKDSGGDNGADAGWVKGLTYTPDVEIDPDNLPSPTFNFHILGEYEGYTDADFWLSETVGGDAVTSKTAEMGSSYTLYANRPEEYDIVKLYSDADCTKLVSTGEYLSFVFGASDKDFYVTFSIDWAKVAGYTQPDNLTVTTQTTYGYIWTTTTDSEDNQLLRSGNYGVKGKMSYLKIMVKADGVLHFDWFMEEDNNSFPSYFCYTKNGGPANSSLPSATGYITAPDQDNTWYSVVVSVSAGDYLIFDFGSAIYPSKLINTYAYIKNVYLDTDPNVVTISFDCPEGEGFISTAKNTNPANKVETKTGYTDTAAGTFYVVPNLEEGYSFVGLYTTPDFQAGTEVAHDYHRIPTYNARKFTMNYPDEDVTYYAKFKKETAYNYLVRFDESKVTNVSYTITANGDGSTLDPMTIVNPTTVNIEHDNGYIICYPGDMVTLNYSIKDTTVNGDLGVTLDGDPLIASSGGTFVAGKVAADLYVLNINTSTIGYIPVEGFTASHAAVYTNVEYKMPDGYKNYPWISTDNVLTPLNHNVNAKSYAFLKIVPDRTGTLKFTYKISSETNWDYMAYKMGSEPYPYNGGGTGNSRNAAGYSGYGTAAIPWTVFTVAVTKDVPFYISYSKDSGIRGDDCLWIKNIYVASGTITYNVAAYDDAGEEVVDSDYANFNYKVEDVSGDDPVLDGEVTGQLEADFTADAGKMVTLTACPQPETSQFLRWVTVTGEAGNETETFYSSEPEISFIATDSLNLRAIFTDIVSDDDAVAMIGSAKFGDVAGAINAAIPGETVVVLSQNPELSDNVTVKSGVTLLIPFNGDHTLYTTHTDKSEYTGGATEGFSADQVTKSPNAYCKLTIPDGVTLTVEDGGAVSVSALNVAGHNDNDRMGPVAGAYGQIELIGDIVVNDGGSLYAWGFITGPGKVTAKSGADVYEYFQIYDFRGGTITANMYFSHTNQFPFNQYYVQNIESEIVFEYGSTEYVNMALYAGGTITVAQAEFIGDNGVFVLTGEGSYLDRWYDAPNDKMHYDIYGGAEIEDISLTVMITFSSSDYYLPINNIDITLKDGSTLDLDKKIVFLPGSSLTVDDGATLTVKEGAGLVFAGEGIDKYSASGGSLLPPAHPVAFAASEGWEPRVELGTHCYDNTSKANMQEYVAAHPATLDNNGTVIVEEGAALVSTEDGAAIYSSDDTGAFKISGDNTLSDPIDSYVNSDKRTELVESEPAVLQSNYNPLSTTVRWSDDIPAVYSIKNGQWGDWRTVTFCDAEGNPVAEPVANVNLADKSDIHDFDGDVAWSGFDDEGKYWKYVENGDWTYEYLTPGVAGTETQLKALPINGTKTTVFEKHSLTLNGDVGVNFYLFDAPEGATMSYSWGDKYISEDTYSTTEHYTATSAITASGDYKLASVSVAPKEIGDTITVNMMLDGNVISTETYSAADYLNTVITDNAKALEVCDNDDDKAAALQELCTSMLQYGAACQVQFGYKTDDLVSNDYLNVSTDFGDILNSDYETDYPKNGDTVPGFTFMGYTMTLNSETVLDLVFKNETGNEYPDFTVTGATPVRLSEGKYYMFDVTDIKINELLNNRTVTINGQNMTVNAGTYIYKAITTQQSDDTLMATMKNLYNYYQKATTFFAIA